MNYSFFVPGIPVAKGSAKAFYIKKLKRAIVVQDNSAKQKPWASMISVVATEFIKIPHSGPVHISLTFQMPRPKSHYGSGKNSGVLKTSAPEYHISTPDIDKLFRCVLDALTGIAWKDDSQVCSFGASAKLYSDTPGVEVVIVHLDTDGTN